MRFKLNQKNKGQLIQKIVDLPEKEYVCEIREAKRVRSLSQLKYYRGVVVLVVAIEMGVDQHTTHEYLLQHYAPREIVSFKGAEFEIIKRTGESGLCMDTKEMTEYLNTIRNQALHHGWYIPKPDECTNETISEINSKYESMIFS